MDFIMEEIELLVRILKNRIENSTRLFSACPPGSLTRPSKRGQPAYLHSFPEGTYSSGVTRYKREEISPDSDLAQQLAVKEYLRVLLKRLDHNIRVLEHAKAGLLPLEFHEIRSLMRRAYRDFTDEFFQQAFFTMFLNADSTLTSAGIPGPDSLALQRHWASQPFEQSTYRPEEKVHTTSRGLKVRSRAELLIAELLYRFDIPFRYEQVIHIGKYELAPDFTFLDANGEEFYWEYCGMMGDPGYRDHQLWRRKMYESIGINEWTNMIFTYDAADGIDMRQIEAIIKTKILPRMQDAA